LVEEDADRRTHGACDIPQVHLEHENPVLLGDLVDADGRHERELPAHDRNEDIKTVELACSFLDDARDVGPRPHVSDEGERADAGFRSLRGCLVRPIRIVVTERTARSVSVRVATASRPAGMLCLIAFETSFAASRSSRSGSPVVQAGSRATTDAREPGAGG
jgi:hypothetical protein